jgi:hypothetical protein
VAFSDPNKALIAREILTDNPPNKRIDINGSDAPNGIAFYTGDPLETFPGVIQPDISLGAGTLDTTYSSPLSAGHAGSNLVLSTGRTGVDQDEINMNTQNVTISADQNIELHGQGYGAGGSFAYGLLTHDGTGPYIDLNAPRIFLRDIDSGNDNGLVAVGTKIAPINGDVWNGTAVTPLAGTWTDTAGARFGYLKDAVGVVHLRGLVKGGGTTTIVTLPVGFRPTSNLDFTMRTGTTLSGVGVSTAGVLTVSANFAAIGATGIYLDVIQFPTT